MLRSRSRKFWKGRKIMQQQPNFGKVGNSQILERSEDYATTAKFLSLYVKESESELLESPSRIFYLRLRNPGK